MQAIRSSMTSSASAQIGSWWSILSSKRTRDPQDGAARYRVDTSSSETIAMVEPPRVGVASVVETQESIGALILISALGNNRPAKLTHS